MYRLLFPNSRGDVVGTVRATVMGSESVSTEKGPEYLAEVDRRD